MVPSCECFFNDMFMVSIGSSGARDHIRISLPSLVCWFLRKGRNAVRFKGVFFDALSVVYQVEHFLDNLGMAGIFKKGHFVGDLGCKWFTYAAGFKHKVQGLAIA